MAEQKVLEMKGSRAMLYALENYPGILDTFSDALCKAMGELEKGVKDDVTIVTTYLLHDGDGLFASHDVIGRDYSAGVIMTMPVEQRERLFGRMKDER